MTIRFSAEMSSSASPVIPCEKQTGRCEESDSGDADVTSRAVSDNGAIASRVSPATPVVQRLHVATRFVSEVPYSSEPTLATPTRVSTTKAAALASATPIWIGVALDPSTNSRREVTTVRSEPSSERRWTRSAPVSEGRVLVSRRSEPPSSRRCQPPRRPRRARAGPRGRRRRRSPPGRACSRRA